MQWSIKLLVITEKIKNLLNKKSLSIYQLSKIIDYHEGALNAMINGKKKFPDNVIKKLLPILETSREEFECWILAEKYPEKILQLAIKNKKEFPYKRKSILTTKIDALLREKNMSRRALAKQISYSQSGLNAIITGKRGMSKGVLKKLSGFFELPEQEIISWSIADKYSLKMLENVL